MVMGTGRQAKQRAQALAIRQGGIVDRRQLVDLGVTREMARSEITRGRWTAAGRHSIAIVGLPVTREGRWRVALAHSSPAAALDGVTALEAAGLRGFSEPKTHISVPQGGRVARFSFVQAHVLRSRSAADVVEDELRFVRPAIAAARAGTWVRTDAACATVLAMSVQQGIVTPAGLQMMTAELPNNSRKSLVTQIAKDLGNGVQALSEWEFANLCRQYRLPEPTRQNRFRRRNGTAYLDVRWEGFGVVVEIDGTHHFAAQNQINDLLRHNEIATSGDIVLRVPLIGLRVQPEEFMSQVAAALRLRGWVG